MCVHRTVHNCCTQYCTEQTWQFSPLPSRQSPLLRRCLFEGRGQQMAGWKSEINNLLQRNPMCAETTNQVHFSCRKLCWKVTKYDVHILWLNVSVYICEFLLAINTNLLSILHRFRDIAGGRVPLGRFPWNFQWMSIDGQGTKLP